MPFMCRGFTFWLQCEVSTTFFSSALQFLGSFINYLMLKRYSFKSKGFAAVSWPAPIWHLENFAQPHWSFSMGFLAVSSCCVVLSPAAHSRLLSRGAGNSSQHCKFTTLWWQCARVSAEDTTSERLS